MLHVGGPSSVPFSVRARGVDPLVPLVSVGGFCVLLTVPTLLGLAVVSSKLFPPQGPVCIIVGRLMTSRTGALLASLSLVCGGLGFSCGSDAPSGSENGHPSEA